MAALDPAVFVEPQPDQHVAAEGFDQAEAFARPCRRRIAGWIGPPAGVPRICSISARLCSTSRMRIQTRALTSPASSTGTST